MSGTVKSSEGLDVRRRRILYRAWHRGTREMDLIMGRFADAEIERLSETEIDDFERLIDAPDRELFSWVSGSEATPVEYDTPVFRRMRDFHLVDGRGLPD